MPDVRKAVVTLIAGCLVLMGGSAAFSATASQQSSLCIPGLGLVSTILGCTAPPPTTSPPPATTVPSTPPTTASPTPTTLNPSPSPTLTAAPAGPPAPHPADPQPEPHRDGGSGGPGIAQRRGHPSHRFERPGRPARLGYCGRCV